MTWDVKLNGEPYVVDPRSPLSLGKSQAEGGAPLRVSTIVIPSFHHGPGQIHGRDPMAYRRGSRVDTTRPGMVLSAGGTAVRHAPNDVVFDGIHQSSFFGVNDKLFLITPVKIFELNHGGNSWADVQTAPANCWFTGSAARWRGKVIFGVEKAPAAALGGDNSARYAENSPVVYDIAAGTFSAALSSAYYTSHIVSAKGSIWWIQNRGRHAAPRLYWSDDTETNFGSFGAGRLYGPFDLEQGGYCTRLHMAGQSILIFKRDGSVTGVDEAKIWTNYSKDRGPINDDFFGSSLVELLSTIVFSSSEEGALVFNPSNLGLDSIEPSRVNGYVARADNNFIGSASAFTVRGSELLAFGRTPNGVAMYTGMKYGQEGFFYASDYGVYAATGVAPAVGPAVVLRDDAGGSALRSASTPRSLRSPETSVTFNESPVAATVYHHTGTPEHYHIFVAHHILDTGKLKIYQIDLADTGWREGPATLATGSLHTSNLYSEEGRGSTMIPLQFRGYVNLGVGKSMSVALGIEEGSPSSLGAVTQTGAFSLPMPTGVAGLAGRFFRGIITTPDDPDFRLECPLFLDVFYAFRGDDQNDYVTLNIVLGDVSNNNNSFAYDDGLLALSERVLALQHQSVTLEWRHGVTWNVYIENVEIAWTSPDQHDALLPGRALAKVQCRRLP